MTKRFEVFTTAVALFFFFGDIKRYNVTGQVFRQRTSDRFFPLVSLNGLGFWLLGRFFNQLLNFIE